MPPKFAERLRHSVSAASRSSASVTESADFLVDSHPSLSKSLSRSAPVVNDFAVLRASDVRRIKNTICDSKYEDETALREKERHANHLKSVERTRMWPDTIENQREIKLRKAKEKLDAEEEERCRIDAEEALYQEEMRKASNERAWQMLQQQSIGMRQIQSKQLLCDVIQEREAQAQVSRMIKDRKKQEEEAWLQVEKERRQQEEQKEKLAMLKELEAKADLAKALEEQQKLVISKVIDEKKRALEEKAHVEELVRRAAEEEKEKTTRKKELNKKALEETKVFHEMKKEMDKMHDEQEKQEFEASMKYLDRRNRVETRRKEIEKEMLEKKQLRSTILAQNHHDVKETRMKEEDERRERYIKEKEMEKLEKERAEEMKRKSDLHDVDCALKFHLEEKSKKKLEEKEKEAHMRSLVESQLNEIKQEEKMQEELRFTKAARLKEFNLRQSAQKKAHAEQEREEELIQDSLIGLSVQLGDEAVQSYVNHVTQKLSQEGKLTSPMKKIDPGYRIIIPS